MITRSCACKLLGMVVGRKVEDERQAVAYLAAAGRSGQPLGAWARARGIDGRSLRAWHMNLSRRGHTRSAAGASRPRAKSPKLVELVPAPRSDPSARYLITVGGGSVEVGSDFDEATLGRLLGVLRAC